MGSGRAVNGDVSTPYGAPERTLPQILGVPPSTTSAVPSRHAPGRRSAQGTDRPRRRGAGTTSIVLDEVAQTFERADGPPRAGVGRHLRDGGDAEVDGQAPAAAGSGRAGARGTSRAAPSASSAAPAEKAKAAV